MLSDGRRCTEPGVRHSALYFEAAEAARNVAEGRFESTLRPLDDSLVTLDALDAIHEVLAERAQPACSEPGGLGEHLEPAVRLPHRSVRG